MKHLLPIFITIFCTVHTINASEQAKQPSTKGIIPLFAESDKDGIKRFNKMHETVVNCLNVHAIMVAGDNENARIEELRAMQHDYKLLRNKCKAEKAYSTARGSVIHALQELLREQGKQPISICSSDSDVCYSSSSSSTE